MCGRFALATTPQQLREDFSLVEVDDFPPRYNIAPTQPILGIVQSRDYEGAQMRSNRPQRAAVLMRWGFLPGFIKDPADFPLLINARAETASQKPSFRGAMRHRRILIPATGYYEWQRRGAEKAQAFLFRPKSQQIIGFAGLMECWAGADGSEVDTAAILTTKANRQASAVHERMPVVITPENYARWLDCAQGEPRHVADLLEPVPDDFFEIVPIGDKVNKVANMGEDIQKPVTLEPSAEPQKAKPSAQLSLF